MLWHKCLGHISNQHIQRLVSEGILDPLDLSNFQVYIECIKGKQTNIRKYDVDRCDDVLELIHTNICDPFPTPFGMDNNILSLSLTITHAMAIFI